MAFLDRLKVNGIEEGGSINVFCQLGKKMIEMSIKNHLAFNMLYDYFIVDISLYIELDIFNLQSIIIIIIARVKIFTNIYPVTNCKL